jgi:hypothetical protein
MKKRGRQRLNDQYTRRRCRVWGQPRTLPCGIDHHRWRRSAPFGFRIVVRQKTLTMVLRWLALALILACWS